MSQLDQLHGLITEWINEHDGGMNEYSIIRPELLKKVIPTFHSTFEPMLKDAFMAHYKYAVETLIRKHN